MDTKSKNRRYPVLIWGLAIMLAVVGLLSLLDVIRHRAYLHKDHYFTSAPFASKLMEEWNLIQYYHIDYKNYPEWGPAAKANTEYVRKLRSRYESLIKEKEQQLRPAYESQRPDSAQSGKAEETPRLPEAQAQEQIGKAAAQLNGSMQQEIGRHIAFMESQYNDVKRSLDERKALFGYYIENLGTGEIYTNLPGKPDQGMLKDTALAWNAFPEASSGSAYLQSMNQYFKQNRLEGLILINKDVRGYSQVHADYYYYLSIRERILKECALSAICLLFAAAVLLYIRKYRVAGGWTESFAMYNRRIPLDLRLLLLLCIVCASFGMADPASMFRLPLRADQILTLALLCLGSAYALLQFEAFLLLYRNKEELIRQWEMSYTRRLSALLRTSFTNRSLFFKAAVLFGLTVLLGICAVLLPVAMDDGLEELAMICAVYAAFYAFAVLPYVLKRIAAFNSIVAGSEAIAAGDFAASIEKTGSGSFYRLAYHLNNMKLGFQKSLQDQMKSERLKTELITNVSHDLKTPLTSIINYVDLLKKEDITDAEREAYVAILERKTQRLKALIDDLFEASKMASGAAELNPETVNVASLLDQALAEFSERIEASACQFKVVVPGRKVLARLDGKKIWRVFENLIGNAIKYAMPNTRVHVTLTDNERQVMLTMKNVSAYEIEFEVEELFERFKRGDRSRHTEGSGLGLAIAKSIVDLHGGELRIEIDGDYFKVTVTLNKNLEHTSEGS